GGTVTLTDTDVGLVALEGTDQTVFDDVTRSLESDLPAPFVLTASLPVAEVSDGEIAPPRFSAARDAQGALQVRGDVGSDLNQDAIQSFAKAKFGADQVNATIGDHPNLPQGWPVRTMAALAALAELNTGQVTVNEDEIRVSGQTGLVDSGAVISQIFAQRLGDDVNYTLNVNYVEALDPTANLLDPGACVAEIIALTDTQKITFEPGSTNLDSDSRKTVDQIAEILGRCPDADIEISGHTDSQGREEMNLALSRERAGAVLNALRIQRVPVKSIVAEGYGESQPIADNDSASGREANRRIEFRLVSPSAVELTPDAGGDDALEDDTPQQTETENE
ncbi:MAG: OmpA family protein, partial [Pseudomonadota bacterium]